MEYVRLEENWKKIIENFIKKSLLLILNKRIKSVIKNKNEPNTAEVIILISYIKYIYFLVIFK